jgi:hypothetical protein
MASSVHDEVNNHQTPVNNNYQSKVAVYLFPKNASHSEVVRNKAALPTFSF